MSHHELLAVQEQTGNGMSVYLKPSTSVIITPKLVEEIRTLQDSMAEKYLSQSYDEYFYIVWYLDKCTDICCRGLDFNYMVDCIKHHKEHELEYYINRIFNLIFLNYIGLGLPIINCSIITRPLTGFSQEFFFMNQICFLHNKQIRDFKKIQLHEELPNLSFNKEIYDKNNYFYYKSLQAEKMKSLIEKLDYEIPNAEEIECLRAQFDALKEQTISRILDIASRDLKILEKMGCKDLNGAVPFKLCA